MHVFCGNEVKANYILVSLMMYSRGLGGCLLWIIFFSISRCFCPNTALAAHGDATPTENLGSATELLSLFLGVIFHNMQECVPASSMATCTEGGGVRLCVCVQVCPGGVQGCVSRGCVRLWDQRQTPPCEQND